MKIYKHADRLDHFQTGIFAAMDEKKDELIRQGRKVYNLSIGTPDFKPMKHIMDAVRESVGRPEDYKYALTDSDAMLDALIGYYKRRFGVELEKDEITGVHGTQEGMGHLGMAMCNPGDYVLLPDPGYPIYEAGSYFGGAEVYYYDLLEKNDYLPVLEDIPEDILYKTRYMVVSYPSNPVGAAAPKSMYEKLIAYARKYDFFIINDMAYSDIIFDGRESFSMLSLPGGKEVGVEFFSLSKSFNLTGLRLSYLIGNPSIVGALKLLRSQYDFGISYPAQKAAIAALTGPMDEVRAQCDEYQRRRDAICGGLRRIGWDAKDSQGTMFTWIKVPEGYTSESCISTLLETCGVVGTPGTAFGPKGEGYIRFALVKPVEELNEIVDIIGKNFPLHPAK
ncbi:MAG: aminotransferase class I/II-fold pyridoxal phosphate-dependent enzyme [Lachnospiraceae bacterium]|jgi:LL-diaminopimelate aminotransferase|nr:aminotransferase class I/II-fold pyridoxal phosphate-dependent enzyme [Lachnospiraceae bacterium]MCH4063389.1 aminotransferase class I/II-fold pyridoxal phosphate-dependent enzyme [Lachnospiraceae bacterium]MCH4104539.1 aminotransferase class I/II-fold pyridoxal phosphate-dependent enzyme [Lachnospiraceae bacterium]MCI1309179.1 aminotransferase class I/II-fold pyridoxal phosphate-dependent enzyme [Lachnospiraceae bacterium]MCI1333618.1 aminotransferase class I/II-fold pyridoxal phosphate-dep